jgi:hypothetical protein
MELLGSMGISFAEASADNECDPLYMGRDYLQRWAMEVQAEGRKRGVRVVNLYSGHGTYATLGLATTTSPFGSAFRTSGGSRSLRQACGYRRLLPQAWHSRSQRRADVHAAPNSLDDRGIKTAAAGKGVKSSERVASPYCSVDSMSVRCPKDVTDF